MGSACCGPPPGHILCNVKSPKRRSHPIFVGHLAVALGSKRVDKRVPLAAAVAAAFALDLIWPVLLLLGVETVRINPGDTAFTSLHLLSTPTRGATVFSSCLDGLSSPRSLRSDSSARGEPQR